MMTPMNHPVETHLGQFEFLLPILPIAGGFIKKMQAKRAAKKAKRKAKKLAAAEAAAQAQAEAQAARIQAAQAIPQPNPMQQYMMPILLVGIVGIGFLIYNKTKEKK